MSKIAVVGSLNMDLVVTADELPRVGETVMGNSLTYVCGGKGGNQAVAAARMGAEVAMIGCVGSDVFGTLLRQGLDQSGINSSCVRILAERESGVAVITVKEGENSIIVIPGTNAEVTSAYVEDNQAVMAEADMILLQLEIPMKTVEYVASFAKSRGIPVMLNPAPAKPLSAELLNGISYLIVNETESEFYTGLKIAGKDDICRSMKLLKDLGVKHPVITLGRNGSAFEEDGKVQVMPARKVTAVDTTAAGDSFAAALAFKLTEGASLSEAAYFATAVSSIVVTRKGAQTSIPEIEEVMDIL